jgi:hypothetical protein
LKTYLNLSDGQLQSLEDIYKSRMAVQQAIYQQISAKQTQLNQLLAGGTSDAAAVGQLMIDIHNLQKQLPIPNSTYRDQALKVLTPDQAAKVPALTSALVLQQTAWQAVTLDLVDAPVSDSYAAAGCGGSCGDGLGALGSVGARLLNVSLVKSRSAM